MKKTVVNRSLLDYKGVKDLSMNVVQPGAPLTRIETPRSTPLFPTPKACQRCNLAKTSQTVCLAPHGPARASLMLVGEAVGEQESAQGKPFVGDPGYKLTYLLRRAKLIRNQVFVTNLVRCHPPEGRKPKKEEINACAPYLLQEVMFHRPKVIVAMGSMACEALYPEWVYKFYNPRTGKQVRLQKALDEWRGFPRQRTFSWEFEGVEYSHTCWIVPTYSTGYCLRTWEADVLVQWDLELAKGLIDGTRSLHLPTTEVEVIRSVEQWTDAQHRLEQAGEFVFDLETTGLRHYIDKILCIGFCYQPGRSIILPMFERRGEDLVFLWEDSKAWLLDSLRKLFQSCALKGQNVKFDIKFMWALLGKFNVSVVFDTMVAHHLVDENQPHNLTFQTQTLLGWDKYDAVVAEYKKDSLGLDLSYAPAESVYQYCGFDLDGTLQLIDKHKPPLEAFKLHKAFQTELNLTLPIGSMEYTGVVANSQKLKNLSTTYKQDQQDLKTWFEAQALRLLGEKKAEGFNPGSQDQLLELFLAAGAKFTRKTAEGTVILDKNILKALALKEGKVGEIAVKAAAFRKSVKYVSTYLDGKDGSSGLIELIQNGRIYPDYNIARTRTGRLSEPRMLLIPRKGAVRTMFEPDTADDVFLSMDYSKLELCVMAWLAQDAIMLKELLSDVDLHRRMAVTGKLMRDPTDEEFAVMGPQVTEDERSLAKALNFGICYGLTSAGIVINNPSNFPESMNKTARVQLVDKLIEAYLLKYKGIAKYMKNQVYTCVTKGWLRTTIFGRLRRLRDGFLWLRSTFGKLCRFTEDELKHIENEAKNFQVQSIASDLLTEATWRCYQAIERLQIPRLRMVLSIHDQLLFNCPKDRRAEVIPILASCMGTVLPSDSQRPIAMPIKVDVKVQSVWGVDLDE